MVLNCGCYKIKKYLITEEEMSMCWVLQIFGVKGQEYKKYYFHTGPVNYIGRNLNIYIHDHLMESSKFLNVSKKNSSSIPLSASLRTLYLIISFGVKHCNILELVSKFPATKTEFPKVHATTPRGNSDNQITVKILIPINVWLLVYYMLFNAIIKRYLFIYKG